MWDLDDADTDAGPIPNAQRVQLLGLPATLWLAARQHHDALLRELHLLNADRDHPFDIAAADTARRYISRAVDEGARATWLLIREFGRRYRAAEGHGRVIALTSDHTVANLPYGASKGALDRITLAAARELAHLGITANVINPGTTNTGWMTPKLIAKVVDENPLGRVGQPLDVANLVSFLCSDGGGWINGQLLYSNGGSG